MKLEHSHRLTGIANLFFLKIAMVSLTRVLQHRSEWKIIGLQDPQAFEKEMDANMVFFLVNDNNGICVNGVYIRQYPLMMLKDNQPMLIVDGIKQIMNEYSANCDNLLDYTSSNHIVNSDIPHSLTNE